MTVRRPLLFHPTRQYFTRPANLHGYKANDRLYRALGDYAKAGRPFTLVICAKGNPDEPGARRMIAELGIANHVHWVQGMPRHELIAWYQAADVTVDSFFAGSIGSVPIESMACGAPVMMHVQTEARAEDDGIFFAPGDLFPEMPPIIRCRTDGEILDQLHRVVGDADALADWAAGPRLDRAIRRARADGGAAARPLSRTTGGAPGCVAACRRDGCRPRAPRRCR